MSLETITSARRTHARVAGSKRALCGWVPESPVPGSPALPAPGELQVTCSSCRAALRDRVVYTVVDE